MLRLFTTIASAMLLLCLQSSSGQGILQIFYHLMVLSILFFQLTRIRTQHKEWKRETKHMERILEFLMHSNPATFRRSCSIRVLLVRLARLGISWVQRTQARLAQTVAE